MHVLGAAQGTSTLFNFTISPYGFMLGMLCILQYNRKILLLFCRNKNSGK